MSKLHNTITINAPPEKVWDVLADLEAVQFYNPVVEHARYISPMKEGVGASRQCEMKPDGWVKERVVGWEPKEAITMELYESPWPVNFMRWRTSLVPENGGTRVSQNMEYELKFGPLGKLLDLIVMRRKLNKIIEDTFSNLKGYVEKGARR